MFQKLGEAILLYIRHFPVIAALVLTVWLPGNLLIEYLIYHIYGPDDWFSYLKISGIINGIFSPVYVGGIIYVLASADENMDVGYWTALRVGFRNWGRLFQVRWTTGFLTGLACLALIVPGIVVAIRYLLVEYPILVEGLEADAAMQRSTELTRGIRWKLFGAVCLAIGAVVTGTVLSSTIPVLLIQTFIPAFDHFIPSALFDCIYDILEVIILIVFYRYYREALDKEEDLIASAVAMARV